MLFGLHICVGWTAHFAILWTAQIGWTARLKYALLHAMFFSGYNIFITGSYSVSLPWSGGAYWALLRPASEIFAIPLWAQEVAVPSDQWNGRVLSVPFARTSARQ